MQVLQVLHTNCNVTYQIKHLTNQLYNHFHFKNRWKTSAATGEAFSGATNQTLNLVAR